MATEPLLADAFVCADAADEDILSDVDVEMALMALSAQDVGEPTEDLDLSALSVTEKRVLLKMLRSRLFGGVPDAGPASEGGSLD